jgi:hypothetical protein
LIRKNIYLVCGNGEIARAFIQWYTWASNFSISSN